MYSYVILVVYIFVINSIELILRRYFGQITDNLSNDPMEIHVF